MSSLKSARIVSAIVAKANVSALVGIRADGEVSFEQLTFSAPMSAHSLRMAIYRLVNEYESAELVSPLVYSRAVAIYGKTLLQESDLPALLDAKA